MLWRTSLIFLFIIIFTNTGLFNEGDGPKNKDGIHKRKRRKLWECIGCEFVAETHEEQRNHICEVKLNILHDVVIPSS